MKTFLITIREPKKRRGHFIRKGVIVATDEVEAKTLATDQGLVNPAGTVETIEMADRKLVIVSAG